MARPGRKPGTPRTGGRQKGTPNKRTDETRELIESALGGSPLEKMANLARELLDGTRVLVVPVTRYDNGEAIRDTEESDAKAMELAGRLLTELSQYCAPKRKAIEHTGAGGAPLEIGRLRVELMGSRAAGN